MHKKVRPLIITPKPISGESLLGFVLRTTEVNGYDKSSDILRYAGCTEKEIRTVKLPLSKLSGLYGCKVNSLKKLAFTLDNKKYGKSYSLYGHELFSSHVRILSPNVCPECVKELGYISMFWHLKCVVVCPVHARKLDNVCFGCGKNKSWNRPGLNQCGCGYDFNDSPKNTVENESLLGLMEVVWKKFHREPLSSERLNNLDFPLGDLELLSLKTLLGLIERFDKGAEVNKGVFNNIGFEKSIVVSEAFSNWPNGFFRYLDESCSQDELSHLGLRKQFERFYISIFKSGLQKNEVNFIRDAFILFGTMYWKKALIDKKMTRNDECIKLSVGGINDVAKKIGVMPVTIHKMVKEGIIHPVVIKKGMKQRLLFDLTKEMPQRIEEGDSFSAREAGRILTLPVSVINVLRTTGVFKVMYIGVKTASFHEYDVDSFKNKLLSLGGEVKSIKAGEGITLTEVMRMKMGSDKRKAEIIKDIFEGTLDVIGRYGSNPTQIILNRKQLDMKLKESTAYESNSRLVSETAKILSCDPTVIPWLVDNKFLEKDEEYRYLRVNEKSIYNFKEKYISCLWLAKKMKSSSIGIINRCNKYGVMLINAKRTNSGSAQSFMPRDSLKTIAVDK